MPLNDTDPTAHDPPIGLKFFPFIRLVAAALARGDMTRMQATTAILMAVNSDETTGHGVTVDDDTMAAEMGISVRQVWRHVTFLVDAGWFCQTDKPTRGTAGTRGRRARYRLTLPRLELAHDIALSMAEASDTSTLGVGTRNSESNDKAQRNGVTRSRVTQDDSAMSHDFIHNPESSDSSAPNRLTVSRESSDMPERKNGTVLSSDGSSPDVTNGFGNYTKVTTDRANDDDHVAAPLAKGA